MAVSYSKIGEKDNRMVMYLDEDRTTYKCVSNFIVKLTCEVEAGTKSGFVCDVIYYTGERLGKAYFSQEDVNYGRKRWVRALSTSLHSTRPQCPDISDKELAYFLMYKTDSFVRNNPNAKKCAARVTGLQNPPEWVPPCNQHKKIWVLNADVQIDDNGLPLSPDETPYIWLGDVCSGRAEIFQPDTENRQRMVADSKTKSITALPLNQSSLHKLITTLDVYYSHNFPAALLVLGGFVLTVHYESIRDQYSCVPATIAYGQVQCGKSKATKAALATVGLKDQNYFNHVSDAKAFEFSSQTTLGMVIDDPDDLKQISKKLVYHFEKATVSTTVYDYKPRTTFLSSMNLKMLRKLSREARLISRAVLIHFKTVCPRTIEDQDEYDIMLDEAINDAPAAAGAIIALGKTFAEKREELVKSILPQVESILPEAIHRVQLSYGLAIFASLQLLEKVGLREKYESTLWSYLSVTVSQTVSEFQVESKQTNMHPEPCVPFTSEELGQLLTKVVEGLTPTQILRFLRIDRKATARGHSSAKICVSFYTKAVCDNLAAKGVQITPQDFLSRMQHFPISTTNPQWFLKQESDLDYIPSSKSMLHVHGQQRRSCCQVYQSVFEEEVITTLTEAIYPTKEKDNHSDIDSEDDSHSAVINLKSTPPNQKGATDTPNQQKGVTGSPKPTHQQKGATSSPKPTQGATGSPKPPHQQKGATGSPKPNHQQKGATGSPKPTQGATGSPKPPHQQKGATGSPKPPHQQKGSTDTPNQQNGASGSPKPPHLQKGVTSSPPNQKGVTGIPTPPNHEEAGQTQPTSLQDITNQHSVAATALKKALAVTVTEPRRGTRKRKRTKKTLEAPRSQKRRCGKIDPNKCYVCMGIFIPGEDDEWVGCDECPRWFHISCVNATVDGDWKCSIGSCA